MMLEFVRVDPARFCSTELNIRYLRKNLRCKLHHHYMIVDYSVPLTQTQC